MGNYVWGTDSRTTITWDFTTNTFISGTWSKSAGTTNTAQATDGTTTMTYIAGGSGDKFEDECLKTNGKTSYSSNNLSQKYFTFPTFSGRGAIKVIYASTNAAKLNLRNTKSNKTSAVSYFGSTTGSATVYSDTITFSSSSTYYLSMDDNKVYFTQIAWIPFEIVTFDASTNGGSCSTATLDVAKGNKITTLPVPTKDGYEFDGWYTTSSGEGTLLTTSTEIDDDITYYARFSVVATYDATYTSTKGTAPDEEEGVSSVTLEEITGVSGFKNTGWVADKDVKIGDVTETSGTVLAIGDNVTLLENTIFTAQWAATHTITYTNLKGSDVSAYPIYYIEGVGVASFEDLADVAGYSFTGWSPASISSSATTDQTISATWEAATYTLTNAVNTEGYGTVSPASVSDIEYGTTTSNSTNTYTVNGTTVTATPTAATAEYTYAFDSWSGLPATVTADATVTANFTRTPVNYTLSWNKNADDADDLAGSYTSGTVAFGSAITKPNTPTYTGHTFLGWAESENGAVVTIPTTMPASNKTYYAQWIEGSVASVTYALNTGTSAVTTILSSATPSDGSHISAANIDQLNATGDGAGASDRTTKLPIKTGANGETFENPTNYVLFTFSLDNNYIFTPTDISIKIANVGSSSANNIKYKAVLTDAYSHSISTTYICTTGDGTVETFNISNNSKVSFRGNVTLKLWAWTIADKTKGGDNFRMGTPLTIEGVVCESSATEFSVSIPATDENSNYWGTFSSTYNTFFPSANATVYSITDIDETALTLSSLADQSHSGNLTISGNSVAGIFVPANTGVLIKSANSSVTYYTTSVSVSSLSDNMLYPGTGTTITSPASCKYYLLGYGTANDNSTLGFYYGAANGAAFQVRNGGAYLAIPDGYAPAPGYRIIEEESTTTTLYNIESSEKAVKFFENGILYIMRDGVVYDALGRVVR